MDYVWNSQIEIVNYSDIYLFVNPEQGSWLKAGIEVKELLDAYVEGISIEEVPEDIRERIVTQFIKAGMLVSKDVKEDQVNNQKFSKRIQSIYFFLTRQCNMTCDFCSMGSSFDLAEPDLMSLVEIEKVIDDLSQCIIRTVILSGGEPLLRDDLLSIIDLIKMKLNAKVFLASNGLLFTSELMEQLKGKVDRIDFSLENIFDIGAEWQREKILLNLQGLLERQIPRGVSFVMTRNNWQNVFEFLDIAVKFDAAISIKIAAPLGRGRQNKHLLLNHEEIYTIYREICRYIYKQGYDQPNIRELINFRLIPMESCSAKGKILNIYPNGQVYSCHSLNYEEFSLGNILHDGIQTVLKNKLIKQSSTIYNQYFAIDQRAECAKCDIRYFCTGSCFAEVYQNDERNGKLPPDCRIRKMLISNILWYWDEEKSFLDNLQALISRM